MDIYRFYIYAYIRENGSVYYIGKGKNNRAWDKQHNVDLPNNVNRIVIMESNLSELGAFALERFYIKWYGRIDTNTGSLENRTDGGDGVSGFKMSSESNLKRSIAHTGKKLSAEHIEKSRLAQLGKKQTVEFILKRMNSISKQWLITDPNNKSYIIKNLKQFCKLNGLRSNTMGEVASGKCKHHRGWTCKKLKTTVA